MSTIFDDETAAHVRSDYRELLEDGLSGAKATDSLIDDYEELLADEDQAALVWLGLAAAQLELGQVEQRVKEKALEAIESGTVVEPRRRRLPENVREQRQSALTELKQRLA
jgi:hypothetical protein